MTGQPLHNTNTFAIRYVTVVTPGTPVQGPDITVPHGYTLIIRQQRHAGSPVGYVASSSAEASGATAGRRNVLADNDSVGYNVTNMNSVFCDSDTAGTVFELFVES